jgi:hypothetical protein
MLRNLEWYVAPWVDKTWGSRERGVGPHLEIERNRVTKPSPSVCFCWSSARPLKELTLVGLGNLLDELVVPERGIEPPTFSLRMSCSTDVLPAYLLCF